jgi:hypothetical protein
LASELFDITDLNAQQIKPLGDEVELIEGNQLFLYKQDSGRLVVQMVRGK